MHLCFCFCIKIFFQQFLTAYYLGHLDLPNHSHTQTHTQTYNHTHTLVVRITASKNGHLCFCINMNVLWGSSVQDGAFQPVRVAVFGTMSTKVHAPKKKKKYTHQMPSVVLLPKIFPGHLGNQKSHTLAPVLIRQHPPKIHLIDFPARKARLVERVLLWTL